MKYIKARNILRHKLGNMYIMSERENPEKSDNMLGFNSQYLIM